MSDPNSPQQPSEMISEEVIRFDKPLTPKRDENAIPGASPRVQAAIEAMERGEEPKAARKLTPQQINELRKNPAPIQASPKGLESRDDLTEITLPSNFIPYEFKSLYVKPIKGLHIAKFNSAATQNSFKIMVDAVSSLLEGAKASDLTLRDFDAVLYYLRINNFVRKPLIHTALCFDPNHLQDVVDKKKEERTLETTISIDKTTLKEIPLTAEKVDALAEALEGFEWAVQYPTVGDVLELEELKDQLELTDNKLKTARKDAAAKVEELTYLARGASVLSRTEYKSLANRIELVKNMSPDDMNKLEEFDALLSGYGIEETVVTNCGDCGAEIVTRVTIDAHSFL